MSDNESPESHAADEPLKIVFEGEAQAMLDAMPDYERGMIIDEIKAAFADREKLVENSDPVVPYPVEWPQGYEGTAVPGFRHPVLLLMAVMAISEPTMEYCAYQFRKGGLIEDRVERVHALRSVTVRWLEYIAVQGNRERWQRWRYIESLRDSDDHALVARMFTDLMNEVDQELFPDGMQIVTGRRDNGDWTVMCQITGVGVASDVSSQDAYDGFYETMDKFFDPFDRDKVSEFLPGYMEGDDE